MSTKNVTTSVTVCDFCSLTPEGGNDLHKGVTKIGAHICNSCVEILAKTIIVKKKKKETRG